MTNDRTEALRATITFLRVWADADDGTDEETFDLILDGVIRPVLPGVMRELFAIAVAQIRTSAKLSGLGVGEILQALWTPDLTEPLEDEVRPAIRALVTAMALEDEEAVALVRPPVDEVNKGEVMSLLADLIIGYYGVLESKEGVSVSESLDDLERSLGLA